MSTEQDAAVNPSPQEGGPERTVPHQGSEPEQPHAGAPDDPDSGMAVASDANADGESDANADGESDANADGESDANADGESDANADGESDSAPGGDSDDDDEDPAVRSDDDADADDEEHVEPRAGVSDAEHLRAIDHLRQELESERVRTAEMRDALMRTAADFDNFRKRLERDRVDERKQAASGLVKNLLPVLDAVGRALDSASRAEASPELDGFIDGIRMVEAQLLEALKQAGLEPVPTDGVFDPVHHEALMQEPSDSVPHMTILAVFEPGYRLGGRLVRPARVKVASNPDGSSASRTSEAAGGDIDGA